MVILKFCRADFVYFEGHFTHWKKRTRFFQNKRIYTDFDGFFLKTKGFLPKVYEIFGSEMPLGLFDSEAELKHYNSWYLGFK